MVIDCRRAVAICKQCALIQESQQIEPTSERTNESDYWCADLPELQAYISLLDAKQEENEIRSHNRILLGFKNNARLEERVKAFKQAKREALVSLLISCLRMYSTLRERDPYWPLARHVMRSWIDSYYLMYGNPDKRKPLGIFRVNYEPKPVPLPKKPSPDLSLEELRLNGYQLPKDFEQYDRIYQAAKPKGRNETSNSYELFGVPIIIKSGGPGVQFRAKRSSDCSSMAAFTLASLSNRRARGSHESLTGWRAALRQTNWPRFKDRLLPDWE